MGRGDVSPVPVPIFLTQRDPASKAVGCGGRASIAGYSEMPG